MFLLWLKLSATHILLPQQPNLNVIERKFKRQILMPDPIILVLSSFTYCRERYFNPCICFNQNIFNIFREILGCKPFIPSRHIHSIIKHLVYYTTLGIVKINIFEHFKKYLNSTNIFLETDNNFTQW